MTDILVSHANSDQDRIESIVRLLEKQQWSVWWNKKLQPGEAIDFATEEQLEQARIVITAWSHGSVSSRLIRNTAFEAIKSGRWLPLRFDSVQLPLRYRHYQAIELNDWPETTSIEVEVFLIQLCRSMLLEQTAELSELKAAARNEVSKAEFRNKVSTHNGSTRHKGNAGSETVVYSTVQLGDWKIEESQNRIISGSHVKRITPRSMKVLMLLVEHTGNPVSIQHLLSEVWKDRVVVESVVHRCIKELRGAFEDNFKDPRYIETIAKRGYRIVAPIHDRTQLPQLIPK